MSQMKSIGDTIVGTGEAMLVTLASATGAANSVVAKGTVGIGFDVGAVFAFLSGFATTLLMLLLAFGVTLGYGEHRARVFGYFFVT